MLWLSLALAASPTVPTNPVAAYGTGDGSDGSLTITPSTPQNPPTYGRLAADAALSDTGLDLVNASSFAPGDLVVIWQVTGPAEPAAGDPYADLEGAGSYVMRRIDRLKGNRLELDRPLDVAFPAAHTQVVEVLQFQDLYLVPSAVVEVPPWNGETGGILVVTVAGTLDSKGLIDATGRGFRGGDHEEGVLAFGCEGLDNSEAGEAGEGLHGTSSRGRGNRGTAGGGGNCHNAGGAGGAHLGAGGGGGESYDFARDVGGIGGAPVAPPGSVPTELFLGSGGGGGHTSGASNNGHAGGGVVVILAQSVVSFGSVDVSGGGGGSGGEDGGGGGGAGGTAVLVSLGSADCDEVRADGGVGTDTSDDFIGTCTGPGGGGGGGLVYMSPLPVTSCEPQAFGGANGICDGRTGAGADPGGDGLVLLRAESDLDADGDGSPAGEDCDDGDPRVSPDATEICGNGLDDDCDPATSDTCVDTADTGIPTDADTDTDTDTDTDVDTDTDADTDLHTGAYDPFAEEAIKVAGGCSCQSGPGSAWWMLPGLLSLLARRRR